MNNISPIGHNQSKSIQERFESLAKHLTSFGLVGQVAVTSGVVVVLVEGAANASQWRKPLKKAVAKSATSVLVENRPSKGNYVFSIITKGGI